MALQRIHSRPRPRAPRIGWPRDAAGRRHGRRSRPRTDGVGGFARGRSGLRFPCCGSRAGCSRGPGARGTIRAHEWRGRCRAPAPPPPGASQSLCAALPPLPLARRRRDICMRLARWRSRFPGRPGCASPAPPSWPHLAPAARPQPAPASLAPRPHRAARPAAPTRSNPPGRTWRCARRPRSVNRIEPSVAWIRWKEDDNLDCYVCVCVCARVRVLAVLHCNTC